MKKANITRRRSIISMVDSENKWKVEVVLETIIQTSGTPPTGGPGPRKDLILAAVGHALAADGGEIHVEYKKSR